MPPIGNVIDVIGADSRFSTLVKLIKEANLGDELQKQGPYTVFAPTDDVSNSRLEFRDPGVSAGKTKVKKGP